MACPGIGCQACLAPVPCHAYVFPTWARSRYSVGAKHYTSEITKVKLHWKMPLDI